MTSNNISIILDTTLTKTETDYDINNIEKECKLPNQGNSLSLQQLKEISTFMKKSICRIDFNDLKGTGFLCKIKISHSKSINTLITCNHVIDGDRTKIGDTINISFNNEKLKCRITINESTYVYTNQKDDITIIEITGFMCKNYFLCFCCKILFLKISVENPKQIVEDKDKDIIVFHYEGGKEVKCSKGKLNNKLNNNKIPDHIIHCCITQKGSSGSPILQLEDYKVIGIHIGENKKEKEKSNIGTFIKKPIDDFIKQYKEDHINDSLKSKKKNNFEIFITPIDILIYFIIIISVVAAIILIVVFATKSKDDDKPGQEYIDENNSITILYKKQVGKFGSITIFGDNFVESNAFSCKIYYNGKKYSLRNTFPISDMNENDSLLKIQLTEINNIISIRGMFKGCNALISLPDITKIKTTNITDMSEMFHGCKSLSNLPPSFNWNTEKVVNMSFIFYECESLTSLPDISNWKTNNVKDFRGMFFGCKLLKTLPDISKWSTNKINNINRMFSSCSSIASIPDISNWDISNVVDMSDIFSGCNQLSSLPDISKWKTDKVENMEGMLYECQSLQSLPDISKWNVSKVTNMKAMFYICKSLVSLPDISKWDVSKVTNMKAMFYGCVSLQSFPDISNWNITNNSNINTEDMFSGCNFDNPLNSLKSINYSYL